MAFKVARRGEKGEKDLGCLSEKAESLTKADASEDRPVGERRVA